ncbi:MAG: hypothetical protein F6J92_36510 [Symploca sp. SIO1A3]|nr:hypothetical protein [Symploca sp. SIO1A3]
MIIKYFLQIIHPQQRIFTVLVLIIILSLSACITLGCQTSVSPTNVSNTTIPTEKPETPSNSLPTSVTNAVLEAASKLISLPISQLKIIEAEQQTWPDGCLGVILPFIGVIRRFILTSNR